MTIHGIQYIIKMLFTSLPFSYAYLKVSDSIVISAGWKPAGDDIRSTQLMLLTKQSKKQLTRYDLKEICVFSFPDAIINTTEMDESSFLIVGTVWKAFQLKEWMIVDLN